MCIGNCRPHPYPIFDVEICIKYSTLNSKGRLGVSVPIYLYTASTYPKVIYLSQKRLLMNSSRFSYLITIALTLLFVYHSHR